MLLRLAFLFPFFLVETIGLYLSGDERIEPRLGFCRKNVPRQRIGIHGDEIMTPNLTV